MKGNNLLAKEVLLNGAQFGIQYPCLFYNHSLIDSVGQCFTLLMTQFTIGNYDLAKKQHN
jgi:hypothetical protein